MELKKYPSFRPRFDSTISQEDSDIEVPRYTSLKDLLLNSSPNLTAYTDGSIFDSSNISIRNELVKHAASAYVQSATIIVNRDQDYWLSQICHKMKNYVASRSCWDVYFRVPLRSCFRPIFRFLDYLVNGFGRSLCSCR
ncbi:hypothetical protein ACH5RR_025194 [Cinchona calisaya]|uniref:Uncharacterized protein n=1 Tax=Cinchona calisaya TaxID=153742 RepID=A0ABD2Z2Z5_9GENT